MTKHILLAGVAAAVMTFGATCAIAQDNGGDGSSSAELDLRFANNIDTSVVTDVTYTKDVALGGTVTMNGNLEIDSSAVAVNDSKQLLAGNTVNFREENELNGENGFVNPVFGGGFSESGDNAGTANDGTFQNQIRAGFFAPIINTVNPFDVTADGNVGVNVAAGYYNMQKNAAVLAVSSSDSPNPDDGGWSEASTTSLQSSSGNTYAATPGDILSEDDPESGGGMNNFRDRNTASVGTLSGTGNIGVNAAAGAFNMQENLLTIAVSNDASLAEANTGLVQLAASNESELQDSINVSDLGTVSGAGNIGVNIAAGVGNMQHNSLTIAASSGGTGGTTPDPDDPS